MTGDLHTSNHNKTLCDILEDESSSMQDND